MKSVSLLKVVELRWTMVWLGFVLTAGEALMEGSC